MIGISLIDGSAFESDKSIVKVGYVIPNSPADKSGIKVNDVILKVGKDYINKSSDVINAINKNGIQKAISLSLKRGNKLIRLKVKPTDITNLSER